MNSYGYQGGAAEDKATIGEGVLLNYGPMKQASLTDPVLAAKMDMVQWYLEQASGGVINQAWWNNRTPINPTWAPSSNITIKGYLGGIYDW